MAMGRRGRGTKEPRKRGSRRSACGDGEEEAREEEEDGSTKGMSVESKVLCVCDLGGKLLRVRVYGSSRSAGSAPMAQNYPHNRRRRHYRPPEVKTLRVDKAPSGQQVDE